MQSSRKPVESNVRGEGITDKVLKAIVRNPGIDFKSLVERTALEAKQVQKALPPLKNAGKIKTKAKGIYLPV